MARVAFPPTDDPRALLLPVALLCPPLAKLLALSSTVHLPALPVPPLLPSPALQPRPAVVLPGFNTSPFALPLLPRMMMKSALPLLHLMTTRPRQPSKTMLHHLRCQLKTATMTNRLLYPSHAGRPSVPPALLLPALHRLLATPAPVPLQRLTRALKPRLIKQLQHCSKTFHPLICPASHRLLICPANHRLLHHLLHPRPLHHLLQQQNQLVQFARLLHVGLSSSANWLATLTAGQLSITACPPPLCCTAKF